MLVYSPPPRRGQPKNPGTAGERALANTAGPAAERLLQALDACFKRKERRVEVRIKGLPSLDEYRAAKAFLEKLRWVSGATASSYSPDESLIELTYLEKILYRAVRIREEKRYRLLDFDRNRILMAYRS